MDWSTEFWFYHLITTQRSCSKVYTQVQWWLGLQHMSLQETFQEKCPNHNEGQDDWPLNRAKQRGKGLDFLGSGRRCRPWNLGVGLSFVQQGCPALQMAPPRWWSPVAFCWTRCQIPPSLLPVERFFPRQKGRRQIEKPWLPLLFINVDRCQVLLQKNIFQNHSCVCLQEFPWMISLNMPRKCI